MNYQQIHDNIISNRRENPFSGYTENHHIIPISLGGSDDSYNRVKLTAREHWLIHLLLFKIKPCPETAAAAIMFRCSSKFHSRANIKNGRMYQVIREECAKHQSKIGKQRVGKKNGSYETRWICNVNLKKNRKISNDEDIPTGWIIGRNAWLKLEKHIQKDKAKKELLLKKQKYFKCLHEQFKIQKCSLRKFVEMGLYNKSHVALHKNFKKYILLYSNGKRTDC